MKRKVDEAGLDRSKALERSDLEALLREKDRRPADKINAINWLAQHLMRHNPAHSPEAKAKLAAKLAALAAKPPPPPMGAQGGEGSATGESAASQPAGAKPALGARVRIDLMAPGSSRVKIEMLPLEGGAQPGGARPESAGVGGPAGPAPGGRPMTAPAL